MFTEPDDLDDATIRAGLRDGWGFDAASLVYRPAGFGSHHWLATDADGRRLFATVDDLAMKVRSTTDTTDGAYARLNSAFCAAAGLRDAGLTFVIGPRPAVGGDVLRRLTDRHSLVVHDYVDGHPSGDGAEFATVEQRRAVLTLLVDIHGSRAARPPVDDFVVPHRSDLAADRDWCDGPYTDRARDLLAAHVDDLAVLVRHYDDLALGVAARPDRLVMTHGEPHAGNILTTPNGLVIVDWDTALLAPPERDLWDLAASHPALLVDYTALTGVAIDQDALALYRLWYDLAEIGGYLALFRAPHTDTEDAAESWRNLQFFLRPRQRWPACFRP